MPSRKAKENKYSGQTHDEKYRLDDHAIVAPLGHFVDRGSADERQIRWHNRQHAWRQKREDSRNGGDHQDKPIDASMISIPNMANLSVYPYLRVLPVNVMHRFVTIAWTIVTTGLRAKIWIGIMN